MPRGSTDSANISYLQQQLLLVSCFHEIQEDSHVGSPTSTRINRETDFKRHAKKYFIKKKSFVEMKMFEIYLKIGALYKIWGTIQKGGKKFNRTRCNKPEELYP